MVLARLEGTSPRPCPAKFKSKPIRTFATVRASTRFVVVRSSREVVVAVVMVVVVVVVVVAVVVVAMVVLVSVAVAGSRIAGPVYKPRQPLIRTSLYSR
jgi:uncharacterized membrane protein